MTGPEPTGRRPHGARADESAGAHGRGAPPEPRDRTESEPDPHRPASGPDHPAIRDDPARADRDELARRVHVDLPRVRPEDMVATQEVEAAPDPQGGRDTERDFMLRYAAGI